MSALSERASDKPGAIQAPATNLTLGSGVVALIGSAVTLFNDSFKSIFGDTASTTIKASVLIAVIAAWALIAVADLLARAIAKSASERSDGAKAKAAAMTAAATEVVPLPKAMAARKTQGTDEKGFTAAALRLKADGETADSAGQGWPACGLG